MKSKTIKICSEFPASVDEIWNMLRQMETLRYIAAPYVVFKPLKNAALIWKEGETSEFALRLFGFFNMGVHTINVIQFDKETLTVFTNEGNKYIPTWNHRIMLRKTEKAGFTSYCDEVEMSAGWKTPIVAVWGKMFYRHRQRKWLKLLIENKEIDG